MVAASQSLPRAVDVSVLKDIALRELSQVLESVTLATCFRIKPMIDPGNERFGY